MVVQRGYERLVLFVDGERRGDVLSHNGQSWGRLPLTEVYKDSDQEVTGTTLTDDVDLTVNLQANSRYWFRLSLFLTNDGATEGAKFALSGTVGITTLKAQISLYDDTLNSLAAFARVTALASAVGGGASVGDNYASIEGAIETSTPGTFLLQFAQNAAGASLGVHCQVGSSMVVRKLRLA